MYQINGRNIVDEYELTPRDSHASFYKKAIVYKLEDISDALPEGKYRIGLSLTYGYGPYIW